jgi:TATA-box binding protein (TBP) (component of TFIID and TFIIIB)
MFSYILTMDEFRNAIPEKDRPSWIKLTTITMVSQFLKEIDIQKLRHCFTKLGTITLRPEGSKHEKGFTWTMKETAFYNQITIGYFDGYSNKSIKVFPNGSIQVAGCSDLFDCNRIIKQLTFILKMCSNLDKDLPTDSFNVVMINTNFSLNYKINLNETAKHFSENSVFIVSFDPDRYSAVKIKFKPAEDMKQITASIFSTGRIIVTGAQTLKEIVYAYNIINHQINSNPNIKVERSETVELFDTVLGYNISDWVQKLKAQNIQSWKYTHKNIKINF